MSKLSKNIRKPRFKIGDIVLITYKDDYDTSVCSYRYWRDYLKTGIVKEIVSAPGLERKLGKFNFIINIYSSQEEITNEYCIEYLNLIDNNRKITCPKYLQKDHQTI